MTKIPKLKGVEKRVKTKGLSVTSAAVLFLAMSVALLQIAVDDVDYDWGNGSDNLKPEFAPGEILVKLTSDIESIDKLNRRFEVESIERVFSNIYKLKLPNDADILSIIEVYEANPDVEYAEPNYIYHTCLVPNDPNYTVQWAHQNIQSELAWDTQRGNSSVVIAIVDTGVDWDHPDLAANIWNNTDEWDVYPYNGTDDDNNGYIDDVRGWDFVDTDIPVWPGEDGKERDNNPMDFHGHGTHCSGIAAAVTNNSIGIAGATWNCKIMAVRAGFLAADGYGYLEIDDIIPAINYSVNNGANIISMSFGGPLPSEPLHEVLKYAYDQGALLVAAVGNDASRYKMYPAAHDEVVAVAATDKFDDPASFTNYGDWIEVAAPGVYIYSTWFNDIYYNASGTSMACPHAAGVAALIWSQFRGMTRDQVRQHLRDSTDDLGDPGKDQNYGYGRINAWTAVHSRELVMQDLEMPYILMPGQQGVINVTTLNKGLENLSDITVQLIINGNIVDYKLIEFLKSDISVTLNFSWTPTDEGWYNITSHVVPVPAELDLRNNTISDYALVRYEKVIYVPQDYPTIQKAIDRSASGYTIQVASGIYLENVNVHRSLALIGENKSAIIDGQGIGTTITITVDNVNISGFTVQNGEYGINIHYSNNIMVSNNTIRNNKYFGVLLNCSHNNIIGHNTVTNNTYHDIFISCSHKNIVGNNSVANSTNGISLLGSNYNSIEGNIVSNNENGIDLTDSTENVIRYNNISGNKIGIELGYSERASSNSIYHNNFVNNSPHQVLSAGSVNLWDDGYPSGGNYWSDYTGVDQYSGPYQNETGSDGIGDTPYEIDGNNQDNYPLMNPWCPPDVAVISVTPVLPYGASAVFPTWRVNITVIVENQGSTIHTFNVTAYYDNNTIGTQTVINLAPGKNTTLTFTWTVPEIPKIWPYPEYTISAKAAVIPGEIDTADNTYVDGTVKVQWPGDCNGDGYVNEPDFYYILIPAYGKHYGEPGYDWRADFDGDGYVGSIDYDIFMDNLRKGPLD